MDLAKRLKSMNPVDWLRKIFEYLKTNWTKNGGFKSKWNWFIIFVVLYSIYAWLKKNGLWFKYSIKNKHVFLTGAGSGLGRLVAIRLARHGTKLTIVDIDEKSANTTKNMIKAQTGNTDVQVFKLDVANRDMVREVAQKTRESAFGPVDILINNAGLVQGKFFLESNEETTSKIMTVNAESNFWTIREFLPSMIERNKGQIVAIASLAGKVGCGGLSDYCASKFAQYGFHESLRIELKILEKNINVTTICPWFINTGMFSGVSTGILYGQLDQFGVADRIVNAILQREEEVLLPWRFVIIVHLGKLLLTSSMADKVTQLCGGWNFMDKFRGRGTGANTALAMTQVKGASSKN